MSILRNVDAVIDRHFQITDIGKAPHYAKKRSARRLSEGRPAGFDAKVLIEEVYAELRANLRESPRFSEKGPSAENWRFEKRLEHRAESAETTLERTIVSSAGDDWANQVPTASGLWDHKADKRRAVDLVQRRDRGCYDFIELKVASDNPLFAATEILVHGLLYLLARECYPTSPSREHELLLAREIRLRVLAPSGYYEGYRLSWLESDLTEAVRWLSKLRIGAPVLASLSFDAFPVGFSWPGGKPVLQDAIQHRCEVWARRPAQETPRAAGETIDSEFTDRFKRHAIAWAVTAGLRDRVETTSGRPWVLRPEHREANLFRPAWWSHLEGREHLWARALNSSQCFAVNLFAPLAGAGRAIDFVRRMSPHLGIEESDRLRVSFEASPRGVAERLGERGQATQFDVFLEIIRQEGIFGLIGIEVKLTEREFGGCRGFSGRNKAGAPINTDSTRCLDGRRVFEAPERQCFMAQSEGRQYWNLMKLPGSSFSAASLASENRCPFRHGLYQMMRNRVALDVLRSMTKAHWCDFVVCVHPSNRLAQRLPEPVAGESDAAAAFRRLAGQRGLREWNPTRVIDTIEAVGGAPEGWSSWMRSKYILASAPAATGETSSGTGFD